MSHKTQLSEIDEIREALSQASRERAMLASEVAATRSYAHGSKHLELSGQRSLERDAKAQSLKAFREKERELKTRLMKAITSSLSDNPAEDVNKLSAEYPIVLLPARLETYFDIPSKQLLVRIYPDEISAETHEPELTPKEKEAGMSYWRTAWIPSNEKGAWKAITDQYSAQRSAWIVKALTPINLSQRPTGNPAFPAVETRAQSWTRPARTRVLPDRWIILAYRGGVEVGHAQTSPVEEPLALTLDPGANPDEEISPEGPGLDQWVLWTVDFDKAISAGMALRMPLDEEALSKGFDRLIAIGVKTTLSSDQAGARLAEVLDGHHYTRGLALVKQGTPTNNTQATSSGFPPSDIGGSYSFDIERGDPLAGEGRDGSIFAKALGVPSALADHIAGADGVEQKAARSMNDALWPATLGYFLESILGFDPQVLQGARKHFVDYVRGRGPFSAFRAGATPYGLLPVASLSRQVLSQNVPEGVIISKALQARNIWINGSAKAPRVGRSTDPDKDLLEILAMGASAQEVRLRVGIAGQFMNLLKTEREYDISPWENSRTVLADALSKGFEKIGFPSIENLPGPLLDMTFRDMSYIYKGPLVSNKISEVKGLESNYIQDLLNEMASASLNDVRNTDAAAAHKELLYLMLRYAFLQEAYSKAFRILADHGILTDPYRAEPEILGVGTNPENAWDRLGKNIAEVTGNSTLWDYLMKSSSAMASYRSSIENLQPLPTAELHRLFTETLDVCSHRLDAWATSLATRRLEEMRSKNPQGCYIGGFGWAENLMKESGGKRNAVVLPDGRTAYLQPNSGGYIQTPSMVHASAAAVLRSGFLTHALDGGSSFDINLSSRRVRNARWVLDAVRQGQFLGAVLGYNLERGLHERKAEVLIEPARKDFPLAEGSTNDPAGPTEAIAARNVVDGLAIRKNWKDWKEGKASFGKGNLPSVPPPALEEELRALDDLMDSVADLLTAETVYQLVKGNTSAASASLDTMAAGARPHDPEILKQPRTGTALTHRVLMVLGGDILLVDAWKNSPLTFRAKAEPFLNRWSGQMLGDPEIVRCKARFTMPGSGGAIRNMEMIVTLKDLKIRPVDFLVLLNKNNSGGEIHQRIAEIVLRSYPEARDIQIDMAADIEWDRRFIRTFPEIMEVGRAVNDVISSCRPLTPEDIIHPSTALAMSAGADRMGKEALDRADDALNALRSEKIRLKREIKQLKSSSGNLMERSDLIGVLKRASLFGLEGAFPVTTGLSSLSDAELLSTAGKVLKQAEDRFTDASHIRSQISESSKDADKVKAAMDITKAVFGQDFVFLPRFMPANATELGLAMDAGKKGLIDPDQARRDNIVRKWILGSSRVRKPMERWRKLWLYAEALGVPAARIDAAQLPYADGVRWAALEFEGEENRPTSGNLSLLLYRPSILGLLISPKETDPWVGMVLDEWTETIPSSSENTGIAFHYDNPGAEAPQALLIAVPPADSQNWDLDVLVDAVKDTMDLSMMRLADLEMIEELSQMLPLICLASNTGKDAISVDIGKEIKGDPKAVGGI